MPKVSVITVVFNGEQGIENTIKSVIDQTFLDKEFIVIDGASTDLTVEIINKYRDRIDVFVSEKDNGIYDAMNKGLAMAKGEWISFMNSGDTFYTKDAVAEFFKRESEFKRAYIAFGDVNIIHPKSSKMMKQSTKNIRYDSICHQGEFVNRKVLLAHSGYNAVYKVYADFDFQLKAFLEGEDNLVYVPVCLANYNMEGVSSKMFYHFLPEYLQIIKKIPLYKRLGHYNYAFQYAVKSFLYEMMRNVLSKGNGA
jgi:glycosyltransferase involved in cell wall biosynthesis